MNNLLKKAFMVAALSSLSVVAAAKNYLVSINYTDSDKEVFDMTALVENGQEAHFSSSEHKYEVSLSVTELPDESLLVKTDIKSHAGDMAPTVTLYPNKPSSYHVGNLKAVITVMKH